MNIKHLRQQLADLAAEGNEILKKAEEEHRGLSAEEKSRHDEILAKAAEVQESIRWVESQMDRPRRRRSWRRISRKTPGQHILFLVYDPNREISDDDTFRHDFESRGRAQL